MFSYLQSKRLPVDDFITYVGKNMAPTWQLQVRNAADMINQFLADVLANGGEGLSANLGPEESVAEFAWLLNPAVTDQYCAPEVMDKFMDKYVPIADQCNVVLTIPAGSNHKRNQISGQTTHF
jgi:hypothetical protein